MTARRDRVYCAGIIVQSFMAPYRDTVYVAREIVMSLYGSLQCQCLWCKCNCNKFVWQHTGTEFIMQGEF